nr:AraC family transcriptional regulator [Paraburkholderia humisilvae]
MSRQGLWCRFDSSGGRSTKYTARAGGTEIAKVDSMWQTVSPFTHAHRWNDEHVYVKIVTGGTYSIKHRGEVMSLRPGEIAVLDPLSGFDESVRESARQSLLYVQRSALRERGLPDRFPLIYRPDLESPDVCALREFVVYLTSQIGNVSDAVLERLGNYCLDLMHALFDGRGRPAPRHTSSTTALRATQVIARRIDDPDLSVASIATELNMSIRTLTRALRANGMSAMRYAWSLRLEHAAQLLASEPERAVLEIAYRCGFRDPSHFSREFKKRYDMTPREYAVSREAAREEDAAAGKRQSLLPSEDVDCITLDAQNLSSRSEILRFGRDS